MTPNDVALGQASPKNARVRHAAPRVINLAFCPLSIIELILPCDPENQTKNNPCRIPFKLFSELTSYVALRDKFRSSVRQRANGYPTSSFHTRSANCEHS